ncbi:MAG: hypothetical protein WAM82_25320 [Thermoanaerobaculia bacterium]
MSEPVFQPSRRADGTLDPECLERMGPDWLTGWMRERLSGRDPWFPLDRRSDEDPESFIVGLLRGLGTGHPLVPLLGRVARRLLEEAEAAAAAPPAYLRPLLRLCQQTALPATAAWFAAELETLAAKPETFASRWPERALADEILFAALRQSPGWLGSPARQAWETLLTRPETTTFALSALGTSLQEQVSHIAVWWEACPKEEREMELSQLIFAAVTAEGPDEARDVLAHASSFPPELRHAIDRELQANGVRPVFTEREPFQYREDSNRSLRVFLSVDPSISQKILDILTKISEQVDRTLVLLNDEDLTEKGPGSFKNFREKISSADVFIGFLKKDRPWAYWELGFAQGIGLPTLLVAEPSELTRPIESGRNRLESESYQKESELTSSFRALFESVIASGADKRTRTTLGNRGHRR